MTNEKFEMEKWKILSALMDQTAADIHPETIKALLGVHKVAVELAEKSQTEVGISGSVPIL